MAGAQIEMLRRSSNIGKDEIDLPTFPVFALFDPALGLTTVIPQMDPTRPAQVDPEEIIGAIERFGVTNMFASPALLNRVGRYGAEHGVKLPTLKRVVSALLRAQPRVPPMKGVKSLSLRHSKAAFTRTEVVETLLS